MPDHLHRIYIYLNHIFDLLIYFSYLTYHMLYTLFLFYKCDERKLLFEAKEIALH